ncbi:alginate lyase family protein [Ferruginibacter sp. HRS2-29]|uniref:alginate lyase family protein n=1 Tax=Ferruginibacter sp. HRS2-29 TaxID=2487334 RepID=UPI0020CED21D|nr:alginate lyase family protein [Ferruginibacter sp. HRS2-29]MCP9749455.1 hypothetical protein [Ferruginibacter sp. HRS2-29]
MKGSILFIAFIWFAGLSVSLAQQAPTVFSIDAGILQRNKTRIKKNDEGLLPAYKKLLKDADKALAFGPVSVMEKKNVPPSGDKHDYMSLAPYFWPDPSKADGLPYIRKDGQTNPEVKEYKDKEYLPKLCEIVHTLSLAYYFSGDAKYAGHASNLLRVWFIDTATKMNPNLNFAQAMKGHNTGRGAGMIDTRHFVKLIDAIGLLAGAKSWKDSDQASMKNWFRQYLNWMQTSRNGVEEMNAQNNHGSWYDAQRLSIALFLDSAALATKTVEHAAARLDKQMDGSGRFPREMERTISLHYSTFVMDALFVIAKMSEKTPADFWNLVTPSGKSLKKGFDELRPYLAKEKQWDGPQIKPYEYDESYPILYYGNKKYGCKNCITTIKEIAAKDAATLRLKLLTDSDF